MKIQLLVFEPLPISEDDIIESFTVDPNSGNLYTINSGLDESFNTVRSVSFLSNISSN